MLPASFLALHDPLEPQISRGILSIERVRARTSCGGSLRAGLSPIFPGFCWYQHHRRRLGGRALAPLAPGVCAAPDHATTSLPVMFGWTRQTNTYSPAARA